MVIAEVQVSACGPERLAQPRFEEREKYGQFLVDRNPDLRKRVPVPTFSPSMLVGMMPTHEQAAI